MHLSAEEGDPTNYGINLALQTSDVCRSDKVRGSFRTPFTSTKSRSSSSGRRVYASDYTENNFAGSLRSALWKRFLDEAQNPRDHLVVQGIRSRIADGWCRGIIFCP